MKEETNLTGVFRQRRNFLLASVVFSSFLFFEVKASSIEIFGMKFILDERLQIEWIVFAFWAYFFWRYHQYCDEARDLGVVKSWYRYWDRYGSKVVQEQARRNHPDAVNTIRARISGMKRISFSMLKFEDKLHFKVEGDEKTEYRDASFEMSRLRLLPVYSIALAAFIVNEPRFTDFALPYIIGIAILLSFLAQMVG